MKRLIKNILIFVIIISMITMLVSFVYVKRRGSYPYDVEKFDAIPDAIQVCNFGSSHGLRGFIYEDLEDDYDCFNFSTNGQTLSYDYRLFQYYGNHIVEGSVVFITVSDNSLFGTKETSRDEFSLKNKRYYLILPKSLIKEYNCMMDVYVRLFPALAVNTGNLIKTLLGMEMGEKYITTAEEVAKQVNMGVNRQIGDKEIYYDNNGNRIENEEEIGALYALIRGCQEKGAIPILISTPYLHEYMDLAKEVAPDFYEHFYSILDRVVKDTGVEYYDYRFDERFVNEYSWFGNINHLNKEGARNFVNIVMEEIVYANGYLDK